MEQNRYESKKLGVGEMRIYDFGGIKLHAYQTNDPLADESFLVETSCQLVGIESPGFHANLREYAAYIGTLGKPLTHLLLAYHPAGSEYFHGAERVATQGAVEAMSEGGPVKGLVDGFAAAFGPDFDGNIPEADHVVEPGRLTLGGVDFIVTEAAGGFDVEIPAIHCVFTHMMGSGCHNILTSPAHIDAMIAQLRQYQKKRVSLILTSHYVPETLDAAEVKIAYLETIKSLASGVGSKDEFLCAVKGRFPHYGGENYLDMTAGALFG